MDSVQEAQSSSAALRLGILLNHLGTRAEESEKGRQLSLNPTRAVDEAHFTHFPSCSRTSFTLKIHHCHQQKEASRPTHPGCCHADLVCNKTCQDLSLEARAHAPALRKDNRLSFSRSCREDADAAPIINPTAAPSSSSSAFSRRDARTLFARTSSGVPDVSSLPAGSGRILTSQGSVPCVKKAEGKVTPPACGVKAVEAKCLACGWTFTRRPTCGLANCTICQGVATCGGGKCKVSAPCSPKCGMAMCDWCRTTSHGSCSSCCDGGACCKNSSATSTTASGAVKHPELTFPAPPSPAVAVDSPQVVALAIPVPQPSSGQHLTVEIEGRRTLRILSLRTGLRAVVFEWALPSTYLMVEQGSAELRGAVLHITFPKRPCSAS